MDKGMGGVHRMPISSTWYCSSNLQCCQDIAITEPL